MNEMEVKMSPRLTEKRRRMGGLGGLCWRVMEDLILLKDSKRVKVRIVKRLMNGGTKK